MSKELIIKKLLDVSESIEMVLNRSNKIKAAKDFTSSVEGGELFDAILMRLQMIGEVLKKAAKTNQEIFQNHPEIEWNKVIGLRDVISHDYMFVDEGVIFNICKDKMPKLKEVVIQIITELEKELNNK